MRYINLLLVALLSCATAQAQQQWELVRSEYYRNIPFTSLYYYIDYTYSNGRSYDGDINVVYDSYINSLGCDKIRKAERSTTSGKYDKISEQDRYYDALGNIDTVVNSSGQNGVLRKGSMYVYYRSNGIVDSTGSFRYNDNAQQFYPYAISIYAYTKQGDSSIIVAETYAIDSAGIRTLTSIQTQILDSADRSLVDSTARLVSSVMQPAEVVLRQRDTLGNTTLYRRYLYDNNVGQLASWWQADYDAKGIALTDTFWQTSPGSNYYYTSRRLFVNDTAGRILGITNYNYQFYNSTLQSNDTVQEDLSYTYFGYVEKYVKTDYDPSISTWIVDSTHYYYMPSWPVNTQTVSKQADDLIAYPVPSSSFVNIKWHTDEPVQVQGRIVNMQGQIVKQWSDDANGNYYKSVHTANLPAGNYYIVLHVGDKQLQKAIVITR